MVSFVSDVVAAAPRIKGAPVEYKAGGVTMKNFPVARERFEADKFNSPESIDAFMQEMRDEKG